MVSMMSLFSAFSSVMVKWDSSISFTFWKRSSWIISIPWIWPSYCSSPATWDFSYFTFWMVSSDFSRVFSRYCKYWGCYAGPPEAPLIEVPRPDKLPTLVWARLIGRSTGLLPWVIFSFSFFSLYFWSILLYEVYLCKLEADSPLMVWFMVDLPLAESCLTWNSSL